MCGGLPAGALPLDPVGGFMRGAARPPLGAPCGGRAAPLAVRKGRCASPLKRLPSTPLLTGLPPRFFRHWRRSAPAVRKGRCASPPKRRPSTPLLTGLPPRFFRHWRRSALPPWPAFKKAGENWLENFSGFPAECAGPPLIGSGGLGLFVTRRGGKGWWMDRLGRRKFQRTGGAAAGREAP